MAFTARKPLSLLARVSAILLAVSPAVLADTKRGVAYNEDINISGFFGSNTKINWQYNWQSSTILHQANTEFVPMLWGPKTDFDKWWNEAWWWVNIMGSKHVLAFNEPDRPDQANMPASQTVTLFMEHMQMFKGAARIGAPAISHAGLPWLAEFWPLCQAAGCQIDFLPVHWYGKDMPDLEDYVGKVCAYGKPVWITEVGQTDWSTSPSATQLNFMQQVMDYLDNHTCIERYAWFGSVDPDKVLLSGKGPGLSELGKEYAFN